MRSCIAREKCAKTIDGNTNQNISCHFPINVEPTQFIIDRVAIKDIEHSFYSSFCYSAT